MAVQVKEERLVVLLELTREGGTGPVEVSCRAIFEETCDHCGRVTTEELSKAELTPAQINGAKGLGAAILAQIKQAKE